MLPGLRTGGVNKNLKGTIYPFKYNNYNELKKIVNKHSDIGIIKMEVVRSDPPKKNFLKKVRDCKQKNIVLIFDECTSGFRQSFGGIHKLYKVEPDMMMLGNTLKWLCNNRSFRKKNIMDSISETFISSTFWTERPGPAAALKTLEIMEKKSWNYISKLGKYIKANWKKLAIKNHINIKIKVSESIMYIHLSLNIIRPIKLLLLKKCLNIII